MSVRGFVQFVIENYVYIPEGVEVEITDGPENDVDVTFRVVNPGALHVHRLLFSHYQMTHFPDVCLAAYHVLQASKHAIQRLRRAMQCDELKSTAR